MRNLIVKFVEYVLIILATVVLICMIEYSPVLKRRIKERFYQGRFHSIAEWKSAIVMCNIRWLNHTPVVPKTDSDNTIISKIINRRKNAVKESIQVWQSASIYLALREYILKNESPLCLQEMRKYKNHINKRYKLGEINDSDYGLLAYAMIDNDDNSAITVAMIKYIDENILDTGEISYKKNINQVAFVDTIGFVCPFLVKYGSHKKEDRYIDLAIDQIKLFFKNGLEQNSRLPFHAYMTCSHVKRGICDWARGLAWLLIGLLDSCQNIPHNSEHKDFLLRHIKEYADILSSLQRPNGSFTWQLLSGYQTDSSAIAVFGWYLAKCAELFGNKTYLERAKLCRIFLMKITYKNGAIDYCQGDTIGVGVYSRLFDIMPFANGFALRMQVAIENAEEKLDYSE